MEWFHLVLAVLIYAKVGYIVYYTLKYLNRQEQAQAHQSKIK